MVILNSRWEVQSATPGVDRWLDELPDGDMSAGAYLPPCWPSPVRPCVVPRTLDEPSGITLSRVLSRDGSRVVLHGARLVDSGEPRIAVIIEPSHPARIYPLLVSAYRLTDREQDVTRLVLQGASTAQIADDLVVSTHTVQQHLKSVFDKTGVRS
ncbi:MAG TPA: helix-turn-helix transcriptional regulator [Nakamurella sp.]|nr:helix-turn-helix transcriptional regulator [Nakamurella sp.]